MNDKPMTNKNHAIKRLINDIFPGTLKSIQEGNCPSCKKPIKPFRDELSAREFRISGLCQKCQDQMFVGLTDEGVLKEDDNG